MTLLTGSARAHAAAPPRTAAEPSLFGSPLAMTLLGVCLGTALSLPILMSVWRDGTFLDTDDAMRLVQVRDWLAGQGWFDLTAHRLDPPGGVPLHWTRVIDVPIGALIRLFGLFSPQETAERLARIVFPVLLQVVFFGAMVSLARKLVGPRGIAAAVVLAAFSTAVAAQLPPGRIDHHGAQITLLVLMLRGTLGALGGGTGAAVLAGVCAAVSLGISIENLPFIAVMVAAFGLVWAARGVPVARPLLAFGAALGLATSAIFVATVPVDRWFNPVCDAFSSAHLAGAVVGGVGFGLLALATARLPGWKARGIALAVVGAIALAAFAFADPDCLRDPHLHVDPLVREVWLRNVTEARPVSLLLRLDPASTLPIAIPLLLGVLAAVLAAWVERGPARLAWIVVAAFGAMGAFGTFWEFRVATSTAPIAALGGMWVFARGLRLVAGRSLVWLIAPALAASVFTPLTWAAVVPSSPEATSAWGDPRACFTPASFQALRALPASRLFAPIDAGSYLLAFTPHTVMAGPYHRNNHGNRLVVDAFLGPSEEAKALVRSSGAGYLVLCPAAAELSIYAARAPDGFGAQLRAGRVPDWLEAVAVPGTPYRVYRVR